MSVTDGLAGARAARSRSVTARGPNAPGVTPVASAWPEVRIRIVDAIVLHLMAVEGVPHCQRRLAEGEVILMLTPQTSDPQTVRALEQIVTTINEVEQRLQLVRMSLSQNFPQAANLLGTSAAGFPSPFSSSPSTGAGLFSSPSFGQLTQISPTGQIHPFFTPQNPTTQQAIQNALLNHQQQVLANLAALIASQGGLPQGAIAPTSSPLFGTSLFGNLGVNAFPGVGMPPGIQTPFAPFRLG